MDTSHIDNLYNSILLKCTFGLVPQEFYGKFSFRHIVLVICSFFMVGNSLLLYYFAYITYHSTYDLARKVFIPTNFLCYYVEWIIMLYHLKIISKIDFKLKHFRSLKFVADDNHKILYKRYETFEGYLTLYEKIYYFVSLSFVCIPAFQAIYDWLIGDPMKPLLLIPLMEFPYQPIYSLFLYAFQVPFVFICITIRIGVFEWAATVTFLINTQVKVMEMALLTNSGDVIDRISLREFYEDHLLLLKKIKMFLVGFQNISSCKVFLCVYIITFFTFLMASSELSNADAFKFAGGDVIILGELTAFCFMGTFLKNSLNELGYIVYKSQWFLFGTKYTKAASLIIQRCQYSVKPTAWFGTINMELPTVVDLIVIIFGNILSVHEFIIFINLADKAFVYANRLRRFIFKIITPRLK